MAKWGSFRSRRKLSRTECTMTNRIFEGLESLEVVGVALLLSLSILSCGSDAAGPAQGGAPTPVATTLTLSATVLSLSSLGETEQLTATVSDQNGAAMSGVSVTWASSASTVASVSSTGLVTAVADGTATVTATSGSAVGTASVTVQQVADSIALSPSSLVLAGPGATATVTASVIDAGGSQIANADLTWSSSDESVATVDSNGLVTAVANGSATVAVTTVDQAVTEALLITVGEGSPVDPAGGEVSLADDAVNLVLPPGAVSEEVFLTAEPASGLPAGIAPIAGTAFALGPDGILFAEPVTLTIGYDPADVPQGVPEAELRLHKLVGSGYVEVDAGAVDVTNHTVSGTINGFSVFVILPRMAVTTTSLQDGFKNVNYGTETLFATGGDGSYSWSVVAGSLPPGLSLTTNGVVVTGTPTVTGAWTFTVEVTSGGQSARQALSIDVSPTLEVTTTSLPNGVPNGAYQQTLLATGGDGNYTWSVTVGSLPLDLLLNPSTGEISGTTTGAGSTFTVPVLDGHGERDTQQFTIEVTTVLTVFATSLSTGTENVAYSSTLTATGGDGSYTWALASGSGSLPTGLNLASNGDITGTPTVTGAWNFTVEVTSGGQSAQQALSIDVLVVASIEVSPTQVTLRAIGTTQQFTAVAKDASGAAIPGKTFSWSSSEPVVATIDATSGLATAVDNGTTAITATSDGVSGSTALQVEREATHIIIVTEPTDAVSGEPISPAVVAEIRYANGDLAEFVVAPVTLAIESNPRGGTLSGITTLNTTGGVATFHGLSIDKPATDYTLTAASGSLASATSEPFSIAPPICTLAPTPRPLPTGQGGPYTVDESRIPDFIGTILMGVNLLGVLTGVATGDFNNDGLDDLIYVGETGADVGVPVRILANDGMGSFVDATSTIINGEVPAPLSGGQGLAEDFNGDGGTDVFIHQVGLDNEAGIGGLNTFLLSDGFGGLVHSPANVHDVRGFSHTSASGDVDCDGDIDIYVGNVGGFGGLSEPRTSDQYFQRPLYYVIATARDPEAPIPELRSALRRVDPRLAMGEPRTMDEVVAFALGAALLVTMGVFGVVAGSVTRRHHELAVRLTVGAEHRGILSLILREAALLVGIGILIGIPGIFATSGLIRGALVGVSPSDPITLLAVAASLALVTLGTGYLAARRVLKIDPARLLQAG